MTVPFCLKILFHPDFFFAAVRIQIHPHRKQACCLYAAQRRSAAFSALSAGILLPRRRAAFSAAAGAAAVAMTAGIQRSILPVFQNLTYSSDYGG